MLNSVSICRNIQKCGVDSVLLKLPKKSEVVAPNRRLRIIIGVGILAIVIVYYVTSAAETTGSPTAPAPVKQQVQLNTATVKPVMPLGYKSETITRNPFALPPDLMPSKTTSMAPQPGAPISNKPSVTDQISSAKPKDTLTNLRLTGIITSDNMRMAVINSGNKSKSYQINDFIGAHRIAEISDDEVIISGPGGERVLNLEASGRKGGDKNAKKDM